MQNTCIINAYVSLYLYINITLRIKLCNILYSFSKNYFILYLFIIKIKSQYIYI